MLSEEEVRNKLLKSLADILESPPEYKPGADIFEDFGLDSLDQIGFMFSIEQSFGIEIVDETFEEQGLRQFDKLVQHLVKHQKGQ